MTNEKSLQVAQGLSILSLLIASGVLYGIEFATALQGGRIFSYLENVAEHVADLSDEDRARLLDAIEMVSP